MLRLRLLALMFSLACGGCSKPLGRADCEALLQRYVALLAASDRPETNSTERAHMQELAKEKSAHDPEFGRCSQSVSRAQFNCAMLAPSTDDFERCLM